MSTLYSRLFLQQRMRELLRFHGSKSNVVFHNNIPSYDKEMLIEFDRCVGGFGEPGFCTPSGIANFADNGGEASDSNSES